VRGGGLGNSGDFYEGVLYYKGSPKTEIDRWNTESDSIDSVTTNRALYVVDMAIVEKNGMPTAYSLNTVVNTSGTTDNVTLTRWNLNGTSVDTVDMTVTTPDGSDLHDGWGASFVADGNTSSPRLYMSNNNGYLYEIVGYDTSSPTAVFYRRTRSTDYNDGASCRNANQYAADTDGDGIPDYLDLDSDNDGIPDNVEAQGTADFNASDIVWADADGDGLADQYDKNNNGDVGSFGLIPVDTDGDGIADWVDPDSDNDGYTDCEEGYNGVPSDACPVDEHLSTYPLGDNGMVSWAENEDSYWDSGNDKPLANGKVNEPDPDGSGELQDEVGGNH
jgi:hypothetical protein